jgi:hypothetical protein
MSHPLQPPAPDRRRFLAAIGIAGLSTALAPPIQALAQATNPPAAPAPATPAKPDSAAAPAGPPEISEDARSLTEIIRRRYGKHLTPDQLEAIARELNGRVQGGRMLKDSKLTNGDEPDVTFHA